MERPALTSELLKQLLDYDAATGIFTRRVGRKGHAAGSTVGTKSKSGYIRISIQGRTYFAHRIAWLYVLGEWPTEQVDHIDGARSHNAWANLREASRVENNQNRSSERGSTSRFIGVSWSSDRQAWMSQIRVLGKLHYLGRHETEEAAYKAYCAAKAGLHTFNPVQRAAVS